MEGPERVDPRGAAAGEESEPTRLLWSGGWDSTFRLLELLLDQGRTVEPHYLIDPKRASAPLEQETMDAIRSVLGHRYPQTCSLLKPTRIARVTGLKPDDEVQGSLLRLVAAWNIGSQYGWLARYCKERGYLGVEMGLERPALGGFLLSGRLKHYVRTVGQGTRPVYEIAPEYHDHDVGVIFRYFRFPVFDLWKTEMQAIAARRGWETIMRMTRFCYRPSRDGTPCGLCPPCAYTFQTGMQWRIPVRRRLRYYATPHGMRFVLKNHPHLYAAARKISRLRCPVRPMVESDPSPGGTG